jgi:hypothetical protein
VKIGTASSTETSATYYPSTRRDIQEDFNYQSQGCENLKLGGPKIILIVKYSHISMSLFHEMHDKKNIKITFFLSLLVSQTV